MIISRSIHVAANGITSFFFFFKVITHTPSSILNTFNFAVFVLSHILLKHFKFLFIYLFIYFWLRWVFVSVRGLSLVAASGGHSSLRCAGISPSRPLLLRSTGSRRAGSVVVAHGPSCSAACGILPDQGSNPCPLHWQADSQPLRHQGRPLHSFLWLSNIPLRVCTTSSLPIHLSMDT